MTIKQVAIQLLNQLDSVIKQMTATEYQSPIDVLGKGSIGQHVRHTLEFFTCLESGLPKGIVNYDERERKLALENDPVTALKAIQEIQKFILNTENQKLSLEGKYLGDEGEMSFSVESNFERELAYNIEHTVHHMAMMRVGYRLLFPNIKVPEHFGVASSTVAHQKIK
ncbi:hypothetical protein [Persicobacter diffluens]|uniref:DinB family protein n=1 Tax=Persicobacter diffluens TaxID=981 RepID=A0AAN5AMH4_9BACT|nr:hypothetical protein PEDI_29480 [Persicobacter diffluens]